MVPFAFGLIALLPGLADSCTAIALDPQATVEGSAIASQTNDCETCDPRIAYIPARHYAPGSQRPVNPFRLEYPREVSDRSSTYAPLPGEALTIPVGHIPEVEHTFAYWEATYPLLNEHGLGFGESTCPAKLLAVSKKHGGNALFSIKELMQVALERCKTARCAIKLMGELGEEYGYYGAEPGESEAGESLMIADHSESWVFHMTAGLDNRSATWVAQRVPEGHASVVANNFIISKVNCSDQGDFLCSRGLIANARAAALCQFPTDADFDFKACYAMDIRHFSYLAGLAPQPMYSTLRRWRVQTFANPDLQLPVTDDHNAYPFSVLVRSKVSRTEVMDWFRDHYEGTEFDMTQGVLAGPFNDPNRIEGSDGVVEAGGGQFARGISIPRTNYALLVEAKGNQSIAWFATDTPASSVFVPFFATSSQCAAPYTRGRYEVFTRDSAWWAFNFVANWMNFNYRDMSEQFVHPAVRREQQRVVDTVLRLEAGLLQSRAALNQAQTELQRGLVSEWWRLADELVAAFSDGLRHFPNTTGVRYGYPGWWLQMIGFNNDFYRVQWSTWAPNPPPLLQDHSSPSRLLGAQPGGQLIPLTSFLPGLLSGLLIGALSTRHFCTARKGEPQGEDEEDGLSP